MVKLFRQATSLVSAAAQRWYFVCLYLEDKMWNDEISPLSFPLASSFADNFTNITIERRVFRAV
jgi:hypothetical protein